MNKHQEDRSFSGQTWLTFTYAVLDETSRKLAAIWREFGLSVWSKSVASLLYANWQKGR